MKVRTVAVVGMAMGLLAAGCATKKFVRDEIGQSQEKIGTDVGRVEGQVGQEKARVDALTQGLGETRAATDAAARKATEATEAATQAAGKAEAAGTKATAAAERADAAGTAAKDALTKATDTDQRLTKLWANRDKRTLSDTLVVQFGFDKWLLDDRAQTTLLGLVKQMQDNPELTIELEGFTDSVGANTHNIALSQRRAESVRRFLVERGVELPRIHSIGLGDIRPVADNKTRQGRDQNRRVSIRLFTPAP